MYSAYKAVRLALLVLCLLVGSSKAFLAPKGGPKTTTTTTTTTTTAKVLSSGPSFHPKQQQHISSSLMATTGPSSTGDRATYVDPDFRLAGIFLSVGVLLDTIPYLQLTIGPIVTLLGILFLVQTFRLKFVCDSTSFELLNTSQESGENIVVGGANRWKYSSFVNYEFFPKGWIDQPQGPILVYFKETQTPSDQWNKGPGQSANSNEALSRGAKPGQVHFFPALCNTQQLRAEWERKGCKKLD